MADMEVAFGAAVLSEGSAEASAEPPVGAKSELEKPETEVEAAAEAEAAEAESEEPVPGSGPLEPGPVPVGLVTTSEATDEASVGAEAKGGAQSRKRRRGADDGGDRQIGVLGTIRMFNADKGWGFIDSDSDGNDIFLHAKHILGNPPSFWIGHKMNTKDRDKAPRVPTGPVRVKFDLSRAADGKPQALNVAILSGLEEPHEMATPYADEEDGDGGPRLGPSPLCDHCGSTIATSFGMAGCALCGCPVPRRPSR